MAKTKATDPRKLLGQLLQKNTGAQSMYAVWTDWVELCALAISNGCDLSQWNEREARYMEIAKRYDSEQMGRFGEALGALVAAFEREQYADVLGETYSLLELTNKQRGQFFTPYHLCRLVAQITLDGASDVIAVKGYVTVNDPACGAGAMLIAAAETLQGAGINYQRQMHVTAQDIDATAAHMAYVQLALLHVPAVVMQRDSLHMEPPRATWYTPVHILDGWTWRLQGKHAPGLALDALAGALMETAA